ncbi:MAG TPA: methyltransferase [Polyangiaceae bacterium]|jgi:2-polyprenyl-3-methyl-5-hydroxy-6-metoxy-1,4-benzoquinol methylase|nr:methyltransferase [Polyangiaceae bacterium]
MTDEASKIRELGLEYDCEARSLPTSLASRFVRLDLGEEGRDYLRRAMTSRAGRAKTALHRVLRSWMSDFDANGLLDMYPMHLLGTSQWKELISPKPGMRHLDVGAGSGDITRTIAPLASETVTTEVSKMMARNLRRAGFRCLEADLARQQVPDPPYDLITCLNVLDRCERPRSLLSNLAEALAPGGRLVIATPIPFDAFFYDGATSRDPAERLDLPREAWEPSVARMATQVLEPLGLEVEAISRAPYLCRGDAERPLYVLDDALFVCRKPPALHAG